MGYGISGGELYEDPSTKIVMDLSDHEGNVLAHNVDTQFASIPNLNHDWSQIIDSNGKQVQTVGHHFSGSRPLNKSELMKLDRRGVCVSCHQTVPDGDLAVDLMSHVAEYGSVEIDNNRHHSILGKSIKLSAWLQILIPFFSLLLLVLLIRKKKSH